MTQPSHIYKHSAAGTDWAHDGKAGTDSTQWFGQPESQGYQVFGVNRHDDTAWEI